MQKLGQKRSHELPSDFLGQPCRKLVREGWGLLPVRVARPEPKRDQDQAIEIPYLLMQNAGRLKWHLYGTPVKLKQELMNTLSIWRHAMRRRRSEREYQIRCFNG
jgi:hypothetical protein